MGFSIRFRCCVWCVEYNLSFYCRRLNRNIYFSFFVWSIGRSLKSLKYPSIDFGFGIECLFLGPHGIINISIKLPDAFSIKMNLMKNFGIANWKWSFSLNVKQMTGWDEALVVNKRTCNNSCESIRNLR